jgi:hypothetical protein
MLTLACEHHGMVSLIELTALSILALGNLIFVRAIAVKYRIPRD